MSDIEQAFRHNPYPGDDRLMFETSSEHLECRQIEQAFRTRHWRDVPFSLLLYQREALCFFSPEGFRYYLPAYMLACIKHPGPGEADLIPEAIISMLTPSTYERRACFDQQIEGFTTAQLSVIRRFLEWLRVQPEMSDEDEPDCPNRALTEYWRDV
ncbi:MAG: DUF6714 family protein [Phycisphaerae bacterium]